MRTPGDTGQLLEVGDRDRGTSVLISQSGVGLHRLTVEVRAEVRQQEITACGQSIEQPGHDRVRLVIFDEEIQDPQQHHCDRQETSFGAGNVGDGRHNSTELRAELLVGGVVVLAA